MLPVLGWRSLPFADRARPLRDHPDLAGDAAAASISAGQPDKALELLELGRAVIWSQVLEMRADIDQLGEADSDLAKQLAAIRTQLDVLNDAARLEITDILRIS